MIKTVGVIGAGTMGFGIAFQFAINGTSTILADISKEAIETVKEKFAVYLQMFREAGYDFSLSDDEVMSSILFTTKLSDLANADLIIESVSENLAIKQQIFAELDSICAENTILTSNTSSLKLSDISIHVKKHKSCILLTHFFNPAHIVPLVEILQTEHTAHEVFEDVKTFLEANKKVTIEVKKEVAGLVANRIQVAMAREALSLIEDGVISESDLDIAIFDGPGFRFSSSGLLKIMDFGGLDVWKVVLEELQPKIEAGNRSYEMINERVNRREVGVKTGKGFYEYPGKGMDEHVVKRDQQLIKHLLNTHPELKSRKGVHL